MKKKVSSIPTKERYDAFLFFVLAALILVFAVVAVQQVRVAQVVVKTSAIEDSVTRIEVSMDKVIEAIKKYNWVHEEASDFSQKSDRGIEVGVGDRREGK